MPHKRSIQSIATHKFFKREAKILLKQYGERYSPNPFFKDNSDGLHLAPLQGATLLHLAIEYDERDIMQWLVENVADVNAMTSIDEDGFGGHTPLFHTTVTFVPEDTSKTAFLLENGANPNHRCSIRKQLKYTGKRAHGR